MTENYWSTWFADIMQAFLLKRLVVKKCLDIWGCAVYIGVLQWQRMCIDWVGFNSTDPGILNNLGECVAVKLRMCTYLTLPEILTLR